MKVKLIKIKVRFGWNAFQIHHNVAAPVLVTSCRLYLLESSNCIIFYLYTGRLSHKQRLYSRLIKLLKLVLLHYDGYKVHTQNRL
jgi:hypothetical protein